MSELHKFLFDGLPVRGCIVRLTDAWTQILARRNDAWPLPVSELLGEMAAAGVLMQSNIKFNGALVLQIFGDGPLKMAVAEVQQDFALRVTAKVVGPVGPHAHLPEMVNVNNKGRCAITLDPKDKLPGQQAYQGMVSLRGDHGEKIEKLSDVLQHYMLQSEQLDTTLVLAADHQVAAGLLIQRLPLEGDGNLSGSLASRANEDEIGLNEHYNRISILASSLKRDELLELDVDTILQRLFWEERLLRFEPQTPRFACTCSRQRVANMMRALGEQEVRSVIAERGTVDVSCDFCGQQYRFDPVDAAQLFTEPGQQQPAAPTLQ